MDLLSRAIGKGTSVATTTRRESDQNFSSFSSRAFLDYQYSSKTGDVSFSRMPCEQRQVWRTWMTNRAHQQRPDKKHATTYSHRIQSAELPVLQVHSHGVQVAGQGLGLLPAGRSTQHLRSNGCLAFLGLLLSFAGFGVAGSKRHASVDDWGNDR